MKTFAIFLGPYHVNVTGDEVSFGSNMLTVRRNGNIVAEFSRESICGWAEMQIGDSVKED